MSATRKALAGIGCIAALAACGNAAPKHVARKDSELALSECMRTHGVPNFPDPIKGPGGEGMSISQTPGNPTLNVDGIAFTGPAFDAAVKTCKLFGGGSSPPAISESQKLAAFHFAQCMRAHGVPGFPDPIFPPGGGIAQPDGPAVNRDSPAVRHAAAICNQP